MMSATSGNASEPRAQAPPADLVLLGGVVYTADDRGSTVQAVAVRDGRIAFTGTTDRARDWISAGTEVIDLDGRMVLPGFIDSHSHTSYTVRMVEGVQLWGLPSREAYLDAIAAYVAARPDIEVVTGAGWDPAVLGGGGPTSEELDSIEPRRPVALNDKQDHALWVNSAALAAAGVDGHTADPPTGGIIERVPGTVGTSAAPYGEPSGTLRFPATMLVIDALPGYSVEQVKNGVRWYQEHVGGPFGITAVYDCQMQLGAADTQAYEEMARDGELRLWVRGAVELRRDDRVDKFLPRMRAEAARHTNPLFRTPAVKFFADGVLPGRTAYLKEDYANVPGFRGTPVWPPDLLMEAFTAVDAAGLQIAVHAVGDAASAEALDALEHVVAVNGERDRRPHIAHLRCVDPADIPRLARLGATAAMQPFWFLKRPLFFSAELPCLGPERAAHMYPMRSYFDAGALVASSSDWNVTERPDPLVGIQTGVMRWYPGDAMVDEPLVPEEACTVEEMIRSFTINGARAMFLDEMTGSLELGKSADLVVLDRDILACRPEEIGDTRVLLTLFRGEPVYSDGSLA
jgi:predicted amidohydrolase YtcJ